MAREFGKTYELDLYYPSIADEFLPCVGYWTTLARGTREELRVLAKTILDKGSCNGGEVSKARIVETRVKVVKEYEK